MKYKVGERFTIREDLPNPHRARQSGINSDIYLRVNPVEYHFRGYEVEIVEIYSEHSVRGYGVKYCNSREFFVHETHIKEV